MTSQVAAERDAVRGRVGVGKLPEGGPVGCRPLMHWSDLDGGEGAMGGNFPQGQCRAKVPWVLEEMQVSHPPRLGGMAGPREVTDDPGTHLGSALKAKLRHLDLSRLVVGDFEG